MHIENVMAAPRRGVRVILHGLQIPFGASGHGVHRDAAQEANLAVRAGANLNGFYQRFQVRRVAFAPNLNANEIAVRIVLVAIDGVTDMAQCVVKLSCTTGRAAVASTRRMDVAIISSRRVRPLSEPLRRLFAERKDGAVPPPAGTGLTCRAIEWDKSRI